MAQSSAANVEVLVGYLSDYIRFFPGGGSHRLRQDLAEWIDENVDGKHEGMQRLYEIASASDLPWDGSYPAGFEEGDLDIRCIGSFARYGSDWSKWLDGFIEDEVTGIEQWQTEQPGSVR